MIKSTILTLWRHGSFGRALIAGIIREWIMPFVSSHWRVLNNGDPHYLVLHATSMIKFYFTVYYLYPPQTKFGGVYRNHPVRPSMYLVSATPPKRLIGVLWNFTQLWYTTCRCAWRNMVDVQNLKGEIIQLILSRKGGGACTL